jgi:hypothetical protein
VISLIRINGSKIIPQKEKLVSGNGKKEKNNTISNEHNKTEIIISIK